MSKQYKLINLETKEEFICDKVVIEGMDYYSTKGDIKFGDYVTNGFTIWLWKDNTSLLGIKKVIASTSASIDIPKVIREEKIVCTEIYGCPLNDNAERRTEGFEHGYAKAKETYRYTEDDMIDFSEWLDTSNEAGMFWRNNRVSPQMDGSHNKNIRLHRKKLLDIWKEQRIETIYFK